MRPSAVSGSLLCAEGERQSQRPSCLAALSRLVHSCAREPFAAAEDFLSSTSPEQGHTAVVVNAVTTLSSFLGDLFL